MTENRGRPTDFTQELADAICEGLADGMSLRTICDAEEMPHRSTVFRWLAKDEHKVFRDQYAQAREEQAAKLSDELFDIADDGSNDWMERRNQDGEIVGWSVNGEAVQRSKLRVDTRKWYLSKVLPKKYGDRVDLNHGGQPDNPVKAEISASERLRDMLAAARAKSE